MSDDRPRKAARRHYRPKLEALEALRLLDAAAPALLSVAIEQASLGPVEFTSTVVEPRASDLIGTDEWDLALGDAIGETGWLNAEAVDRDAAMTHGLAQLNRYMASAWSRAGISIHQRDDCTQAVHATMLQQLGRADFDSLLVNIGRSDVSHVLNRDTELGPDFFRAIDMIKKRAQRERSFAPLDEHADVAAREYDSEAQEWRNALDDAIDRKLDTREADLIRATLQGFSPSEIAERWGLAPKTVSNEKTRVFHKLRAALTAELVA